MLDTEKNWDNLLYSGGLLLDQPRPAFIWVVCKSAVTAWDWAGRTWWGHGEIFGNAYVHHKCFTEDRYEGSGTAACTRPSAWESEFLCSLTGQDTGNDTSLKDIIGCKPVFVLRNQVFGVAVLCGWGIIASWCYDGTYCLHLQGCESMNCLKTLILMVITFILSCITTTIFIQCIHTYVPEINHFLGEYTVAAVL